MRNYKSNIKERGKLPQSKASIYQIGVYYFTFNNKSTLRKTKSAKLVVDHKIGNFRERVLCFFLRWRKWLYSMLPAAGIF